MSIKEIVKQYLEDMDDYDISETFENLEDVEIALEIWENHCSADENLVDIENEVAYQRKHRRFSVIE